MENARKPRVERAVELLVYAPLGAALFARDMLPLVVNQFVARGRARIEQLQKQLDNQVNQARMVGEFALSQGGGQLREQVGARLAEARRRGEALARLVGLAPPTPVTPTSPVEGGGVREAPDGERPDPSGLPIPGYDQLSASQVVARLSGLSGEELRAVRDYEVATRHRKTVIAKIDQLTAT